MTHRTTNQMFGAIERDLQRTAQAQREDQRDHERAEARLDEPLTRREVLEAIESVANEYGDLIHGMLTQLGKALS